MQFDFKYFDIRGASSIRNNIRYSNKKIEEIRKKIFYIKNTLHLVCYLNHEKHIKVMKKMKFLRGLGHFDLQKKLFFNFSLKK